MNISKMTKTEDARSPLPKTEGKIAVYGLCPRCNQTKPLVIAMPSVAWWVLVPCSQCHQLTVMINHKHLRKVREAAHLSQERLAALIPPAGISSVFLCHIENGQRHMSERVFREYVRLARRHGLL
jgi:DNA-binding XRE family transcriptional regulator